MASTLHSSPHSASSYKVSSLQSIAQLSYSFVYEDMFTEQLLCTGPCSQHMLIMPAILCVLASLFTNT